MKLAIVTVSTDSFLTGTMVLFHSFLAHNQWFNGDLIVIDGGLSEKSKTQLENKFNSVIKLPGEEIEKQLNRLIKDIPLYGKNKARFYSLEAFDLKDYEYVLFLDSDILCAGDVSTLFNNNYLFAACPDRDYYRGYIKHIKSFKTVEKSTKTELFKDQFTDRIFNTGVMLISGTLIKTDLYRKLLNALIFSNFQYVQTGHTDTVVLNNELLNKITWLDCNYNFYTTLSNTAIAESAKPYFVHFLGKDKPWKQDTSLNKWLTEWQSINKQLNEKD
jgi:lipopolysaccharide biosynthesis glycosyltransferase